MKITNNVTYLTDEEKQTLSKATHYDYVYGVGLIFIHLSDGSLISWNCSNSTAAKEYLENLGVQESSPIQSGFEVKNIPVLNP